MKYFTIENVSLVIGAVVVLLVTLRLTVGQDEVIAILHWIGQQIGTGQGNNL